MRNLLAVLFLVGIGGIAHAQAPRCMIDQSYGNFHVGTSAAGDTVAMIWCDDQIGLSHWVYAGNTTGTVVPTCVATAGVPGWTLAYLQALWNACTVNTGPLNADQSAQAQVLARAWVPRLNVTGPANQNVYTANADGTRGPQLVIGGFGMQIAPGGFCGGKRLLNAGARFADVSNFLSTNAMLLPQGSYALCSITYPPVGGFTN